MAQWQGKNICDLQNSELVDASHQLENMHVQNEKQRQEVANNPRFKRNNKQSILGNRNPVFDDLLNEVRQEMKTRNFANKE